MLARTLGQQASDEVGHLRGRHTHLSGELRAFCRYRHSVCLSVRPSDVIVFTAIDAQHDGMNGKSTTWRELCERLFSVAEAVVKIMHHHRRPYSAPTTTWT